MCTERNRRRWNRWNPAKWVWNAFEFLVSWIRPRRLGRWNWLDTRGAAIASCVAAMCVATMLAHVLLFHLGRRTVQWQHVCAVGGLGLIASACYVGVLVGARVPSPFLHARSPLAFLHAPWRALVTIVMQPSLTILGP